VVSKLFSGASMANGTRINQLTEIVNVLKRNEDQSGEKFQLMVDELEGRLDFKMALRSTDMEARIEKLISGLLAQGRRSPPPVPSILVQQNPKLVQWGDGNVIHQDRDQRGEGSGSK
jgi:hypothetical protein